MAATISATTASLIAAAVGAAGIGATAYETNNAGIDQRNAQKANADALTKSQQAQANQVNLTKQEAVLGAQGQAQQQTGGSLTDTGTAALTDLLAGYPGFQGANPSAGTSTGTGVGGSGVTTPATPAPGAPASGSGTPDIAAILAALRNGGAGGPNPGSPSSISGGNWQTQPAAPQGSFELSNPVIG